MSGGSFNYLCYADNLPEISTALRLNDMTLMADELRRMGAERAAADTLALADRIRAMDAQIQSEIVELTAVWKAVEWWQSGDYSRDQAVDAVAEFNERRQADDLHPSR